MVGALVIAYGNPLRGDDGAAWVVANQLQYLAPDSVQIQCAHQLSPELVDYMHDAELVVFIDATEGGHAGNVQCVPLIARSQATRFWHHINPEELLALCNALYAKSPQGLLVTVCGEQFNYGFSLSSSVENAIPKAVTEICTLLANSGIQMRSALFR